MKSWQQVFYMRVGKEFTPLCADTLRGAKCKATQLCSAKPKNSIITLLKNNRVVARKQQGNWLL